MEKVTRLKYFLCSEEKYINIEMSLIEFKII